MSQPLNLLDLEPLARERMTPLGWGYFASGSRDEITLKRAPQAWSELRLAPKILRQVGRREQTATVLGHEHDSPLLVAPMAFQGLAHAEAELGMVRGAALSKAPVILSTLANTSVEDVCAAARGPVWFQLYVYRDRGATEALVRRAEAAGCSALVLTVDAPILGCREGDVRRTFHLPDPLTCANLTGTPGEALPEVALDSGLGAYVASLLDPNLGWADIEWLRSITRLPLVIKGVIRADDAQLAADHGVDAVVVSTHGGRQLDTCVATARALEAVAAVGVETLVDGGIRRGTDVLKAVALGASGVLVGRPMLWALAWGGSAGVAWALQTLSTELDEAMALCGARSLAEIGPDLIWRGP
jgi:4-hydroxymandelate oxidase